ncbi:hypothetical protein [Bacteroides salyersiae]|uniref:Uncharacterized protein n=1 Tax=Bacteroides salyersiae TaxID=291644 RepID=A0A7J4XLV9_9BACE|nr:hypothetical protein [Bacteroides salyersiae]KAA3694778.1 hypothetical protein F3F90_02295 [Bacteroides salyersiae]KAA3696554.1 hypothetical protein F3F88_15070 [Bacteroides salyersiae]KAA3698168.1 hypothetical protein F3F89_07190 [Bacteroides salyersiae]KAA3704802.1 hypothetical protein F3F83_15545 [Bacteroides salyersiae]KAA3711878.1 hypothetical protein F3G09_09065 [Bacteroides salyersiae]
MKKRKKKSNKQSRREIIADVKRREAEWRKKKRKERWRICKSHIMLWGTFISFFLLLIFVMLSDIRNTFSNIILGLIAINGGIYLFMYILFKAARNLTIRIPLKNGESTGNTQWLPDSSETLVEPEYLSRCDDKQIVIDNDGISVRVLYFLIWLVIFLATVYLGLTPSRLTTEDYGSTLLLLESYLLILALGISAILQPWQRIVFDRVSRTVTIPGRLLLHKKETIPYSQAELTIRYYTRGGSLGRVTSIIISNSNSPSLLSGVALMPGDIDKARRFARFIQLYMEKEELPDIPEFEKYRNEINV